MGRPMVPSPSPEFVPPFSPPPHEGGGTRQEKRARADAGAADTSCETTGAPSGQRAAGDDASGQAGFVSPDPGICAADPDRDAKVAPEVTPNIAGPSARAQTRPGPGASHIKAQVRAAAKQVGARNPDAPKPQTRRRKGEKDGGGCNLHWPSRHGDKPAGRGRYAVLGTRTAKGGDPTINLGSEPPSERGGCFDISLSNQFGGDNYEFGFGHWSRGLLHACGDW